MTDYFSYFESPLGKILLTASESALTGLYFGGEKHAPGIEPHWECQETAPIIQKTVKQLQEYFAGSREVFEIPIAAAGSPFQHAVWHSLSQLAFGETVTYAQLAQRLGNPKAVRAVGAANGRNPISIIVPCHRVIGADGSLTGYAGGLARKKALLHLESDRPFRLRA